MITNNETCAVRERTTGVYRMADLSIQIDTLYPYTQEYCAKYSCQDLPSLVVRTSLRDIRREAEISKNTSLREGRALTEFSDQYLESITVYRKIAEILPEHDGFVFHGSAVAVDGKGYIFTAKSGTGKTTHTNLWKKLLGDRARIVNGDKPIIRILGGVPYVYGSPYSGKERLNENTRVALKAICVLERAKENAIRVITRREALPMLIQQTYRPADPAAMEKTLSLLDGLDVLFYRLGCNMDISAAELSYNTMKG